MLQPLGAISPLDSHTGTSNAPCTVVFQGQALDTPRVPCLVVLVSMEVDGTGSRPGLTGGRKEKWGASPASLASGSDLLASPLSTWPRPWHFLHFTSHPCPAPCLTFAHTLRFPTCLCTSLCLAPRNPQGSWTCTYLCLAVCRFFSCGEPHPHLVWQERMESLVIRSLLTCKESDSGRSSDLLKVTRGAG